MNLADLDRLCWILIYQKDVAITVMVSSMSSGWVCLFRIFADKVAGVITIYIEVICLVSPSFDFGQLSQTYGIYIYNIFIQNWWLYRNEMGLLETEVV